ncbi:MAG: protein-glutamate O-methyltransferase CheR [Bacteroidota bacterium]
MFEQAQDRIRVDSAPKLSEETFVMLRDFIYSKTGIFFPEKKKYLIEGRLIKRLQVLKLGHFEDYLQLLQYGQLKQNEFEFLCNTITINETSFFRNDAQTDAFQQKFAEEVIEAKKASHDRTLRIWSAACSSGEEPYSLAILYLEHLKPRYPKLRIEIIGTDINTAVLDMAHKAEYNQYAIRSMPKLYLNKYFDHSNGVYRLRQEVKELVHFEYINLIDREKMRHMMHFDFIFCANVLIYFDEKAKIQVVGDLFNSLNRGGYLFIGFSEMLHRISTAFKLVSIPKTTAYKKE